MAYQALGLGTNANDGTGDDLRTGGDKINDNIVEVFAKINGVATSTISNGTAITSDTVALLDAAQTMTNKTLTSPTISGTVTAATITALTAGSITGASGNFDINPATQILEIQGNGDASASGVEGQIRLNCSNNNHGQTIKPQPHALNVTNTMLLPAGASSTLVSLVSADTLTNKTLTAPTIATITNGGAVTIPSGADTLVARTSTDTLTNKTLTSPDINTPDIDGGSIDGAVIGANTPAAITGTAVIGTSIEVTGTAGALELSVLTTTQRNALTATNGMVVYNSTTSKIEAYAGGAWVQLH